MTYRENLNQEQFVREKLDFPYLTTIPYAVMSSKKVCPQAKLHYGCLVALSKNHGYCWATNEQLAEMHQVSLTQIKTWNSELKKEGFIKLLTKNIPYRNEKGSLLWKKQRKIYVNGGFSNNFCDGSETAPKEEGKKYSDGSENRPTVEGSENRPINIKPSKYKNNNNKTLDRKVKEPFSPSALAPPPSASAVVVVFSFLNKFDFTDEQKQEMCDKHTEQELKEAVEILEGFEGRQSDIAVMKNILKNPSAWDKTPKKKSKEEQEKEAYKQKLQQEEQERAEKQKEILKQKAQAEARAEENKQWYKKFSSEHKTFFDQDNRFEEKNTFVKAYFCKNGDRYSPLLIFSDPNFQEYVQKNHEKMKNALKCELLADVQ